MEKIAVIKTGAKQYLVKKGDILKVEKLDVKKEDNVEFNTLFYADWDNQSIEIGKPQLKEKKVKAKVVEQGKLKKVRVVHYKSKTRYHKVYGHRQPYTKIEIVSI